MTKAIGEQWTQGAWEENSHSSKQKQPLYTIARRGRAAVVARRLLERRTDIGYSDTWKFTCHL